MEAKRDLWRAVGILLDSADRLRGDRRRPPARSRVVPSRAHCRAPAGSEESTQLGAVPTIAELTALAKTRLKRMQYRPGLLAGFLASTGLEFKPFL
jgi:hypothetical protein